MKSTLGCKCGQKISKKLRKKLPNIVDEKYSQRAFERTFLKLFSEWLVSKFKVNWIFLKFSENFNFWDYFFELFENFSDPTNLDSLLWYLKLHHKMIQDDVGLERRYVWKSLVYTLQRNVLGVFSEFFHIQKPLWNFKW